MKIIIDTNFIVTCVKEKIDLFGNLKRIFGAYKLLVGEQVIEELKKLAKNKKLKIKERQAADISLGILKRSKIEKVKFDKKLVDAGILTYLKNKENLFVATLDRELKKKIKEKKFKVNFLEIRGKKIVCGNLFN